MADGGAIIRPMTAADVEAAERLSDDSFFDLDRRTRTASGPPPRRRPPARSAAWVARTRHCLDTDPGGCWVADGPDGELVGLATSIVREGTWILATFAVRTDQQGLGLGRALMQTALGHGRHCLRGMLAASSDQRALRRYVGAGFALHPQMVLSGRVDRAALPVVEKVRDGTASDRDLLDSIDRGARDCARGADHGHLARTTRLLVSDTSTGSGYVYADDRGVAALGATNRRTATRLLWAALADLTGGPDGEVLVPHVTAENAWAVDVAHAARLDIRTEGYLALRGMRPPSPWIHHGALL